MTAPSKKEPAKKEQSKGWVNFRSQLPGKLKSIPGGIVHWFVENFKMDGKRVIALFGDGLVFQNPVLVLLLGMCATLAVTTSLVNALGMGLSTTAVLVCANFVISLLRKVIPKEIRIAAYVVVIAGFVTTIDLVLQAYITSLSESLGLFIPLIVVNCLILARAEAFASKQAPGYALVDGLAMGLGFTLALAVLGFVRELLGAGTILGFPVFGNLPPAILIAAPCGGFIVLGCLVALTQWLRGRDWSKGGKQA